MDNTSTRAIASRIKSSRKGKKVSQQALSELSGISRNVIAGIESLRKENIDIAEVSAIATALDVDPSWLAGFRHDPETSSTYRYTYRVHSASVDSAPEFTVTVSAHAADEALQKVMASIAGVGTSRSHEAILTRVEED